MLLATRGSGGVVAELSPRSAWHALLLLCLCVFVVKAVPYSAGPFHTLPPNVQT